MTTTVADRLSFLNTTGMKSPCRVATAGNITLSALQTIDGVSLVAGDRVLVAHQTDNTENGIYVAGVDNWIRALDLTKPSDVAEGTLVLVSEGTLYADTLFKLEPL